MRRTRRRVVASLLSLGVIASLVVSAPIARAERRDDADRIDHAIAYLAAQQRPNGSIPAFSPIGSTADAVLAFVAAGVGEDQLHDALGFLRRRVAHGKADSVGFQAKIVTAVVAARWRSAMRSAAWTWCRRSSIRSELTGGSTRPPVFDDALAVIALEAAGQTVPDDAIQWLVDAQCADGGWQYNKPASANDDEHCQSTLRPTKDFFESDTNTTSYVVQAVEAAGGATFTADPFAFFDDDPRRPATRLGIHVGLPDDRRELDGAGDPGVCRRRHACPGRRARRAAEAAEPRVRRLVVHMDGFAAGPTRIRARRSARSSVCCNGRCRCVPGAVVGSAAPRAGLRVAADACRDGRVRSRSRWRSCSARARPSWPRPASPAPQRSRRARTRRW